jgi:hypothetical protein
MHNQGHTNPLGTCRNPAAHTGRALSTDSSRCARSQHYTLGRPFRHKDSCNCCVLEHQPCTTHLVHTAAPMLALFPNVTWLHQALWLGGCKESAQADPAGWVGHQVATPQVQGYAHKVPGHGSSSVHTHHHTRQHTCGAECPAEAEQIEPAECGMLQWTYCCCCLHTCCECMC